MITIENFAKIYQDTIVKDIYRRLQKLLKDRARYNQTIVDMEYCDASSRYWKAMHRTEQATNEIEMLVNRAVELDRQTGYLSNMHQDRFKFVEKYDEVHEMVVDAKKASA